MAEKNRVWPVRVSLTVEGTLLVVAPNPAMASAQGASGAFRLGDVRETTFQVLAVRTGEPLGTAPTRGLDDAVQLPLPLAAPDTEGDTQ